MKIALAGQGAFGIKHLEAIQNIPGIEVITLTGGNQQATKEVAEKFRIPHFTGVSDPYEAPETPEVVAYTSEETAEESAARILNYLAERNLIG